MKERKLPFLFPVIDFAYIDSIEETGDVVGYRPHLRALYHLLRVLGAWSTCTAQSLVAYALYEDVETADQGIFPKDKTSQRNRRGIVRFENILSAGSKISRKEAEFFHAAFRYAFGDAWADAISADELLQMSPQQIIARGTGEMLPWPDMPNPAVGLEVLLSGFTDPTLAIEPIVTDGQRLGLDPNSSFWEMVKEEDIDVFHPGDNFKLEVSGLRPTIEQLLVLTLCHKPVDDHASRTSYPVFLSGWKSEPRKVELVGPTDGFKMAPLLGRFTWVAIAVPSAWELDHLLGVKRSGEAMTSETATEFYSRLQKAAQQKPKAIRAAVVPYLVAPGN